jgi:predicted dehydrogenase
MTSALRPARYAIVGTGGRGDYYLRSLATTHSDAGTLVAVFDVNRGRASRARDLYAELLPAAAPPHALHPDDLDSALRDLAIERVIVTSPDWTHADLISRSLHAGADVIVEKPLTTDAEGCRIIARAMRDTGKDVTVAFNYRYSPRNSAVKAALLAGDIGRVTSVHFEWMLDTVHGADYFRRWHRRKNLSGGLLVHKASHHFDLVNWWLDDTPASVYARGGLRFYGSDNARDRGEGPRPERGSVGAPSSDPFRLDMREHPGIKEMYLDHEHEDGYFRDLDPFGDDITIEDSLSLLVAYSSGATMTYSLTAFSPWEGYRVAFTGTEGRLELDVVERASAIPTEHGVRVIDPSVTEDLDALAGARPTGSRLRIQRMWEPAREIDLPQGLGAHGGGDARLFRDLFRGADPSDPLHHAASVDDGVRAVSVGIAGNLSLESGLPVRISDLELAPDLASQKG